MTPDLESRLRAVFPTAKDWEPDEATLDVFAIRDAVAVLKAPLLRAGMRVERYFRLGVNVSLVITDADSPSFVDWIAADSEGKKRYLSEFCNPYVVFWVRLSLVDRCYLPHVNAWKPKGDTGYYDIDSDGLLSEKWQVRAELLNRLLQNGGFRLLPDVEGREEVPFVMNRGFDDIPVDDPRWDDDDFEPSVVPSTVYTCLFGDR